MTFFFVVVVVVLLAAAVRLRGNHQGGRSDNDFYDGYDD